MRRDTWPALDSTPRRFLMLAENLVFLGRAPMAAEQKGFRGFFRGKHDPDYRWPMADQGHWWTGYRLAEQVCFAQGAIAHGQGLDRPCPYPQDSAPWTAWVCGYNAQGAKALDID